MEELKINLGILDFLKSVFGSTKWYLCGCFMIAFLYGLLKFSYKVYCRINGYKFESGEEDQPQQVAEEDEDIERAEDELIPAENSKKFQKLDNSDVIVKSKIFSIALFLIITALNLSSILSYWRSEHNLLAENDTSNDPDAILKIYGLYGKCKSFNGSICIRPEEGGFVGNNAIIILSSLSVFISVINSLVMLISIKTLVFSNVTSIRIICFMNAIGFILDAISIYVFLHYYNISYSYASYPPTGNYKGFYYDYATGTLSGPIKYKITFNEGFYLKLTAAILCLVKAAVLLAFVAAESQRKSKPSIKKKNKIQCQKKSENSSKKQQQPSQESLPKPSPKKSLAGKSSMFSPHILSPAVAAAAKKEAAEKSSQKSINKKSGSQKSEKLVQVGSKKSQRSAKNDNKSKSNHPSDRSGNRRCGGRKSETESKQSKQEK